MEAMPTELMAEVEETAQIRLPHGSEIALAACVLSENLWCFKEPQWRPMDRSRCPEASRTHMPEASSCQTGEAMALWGQLMCKGPVVRGKHEALKMSH